MHFPKVKRAVLQGVWQTPEGVNLNNGVSRIGTGPNARTGSYKSMGNEGQIRNIMRALQFFRGFKAPMSSSQRSEAFCTSKIWCLVGPRSNTRSYNYSS